MSAVARSTRTALRAVARSAVAPSPAAAAVASRSYSLLARAATAAPKVSQTQWARGIKTLDFAGTKEVVYERADWPLPKLQEYFKNDTLALIGYGSQGHGQGLNARDNGLNVIVGVREGGESWKLAQEDGWVPGETLFSIEEAIKRGSIVMNLLSDAAQSATWSDLAPLITKGKTLYFSHGFSVVFKDDTKVVPPTDVDVILVAPKGSGRTVRTLFKEGRGINSSIAVWQDVTGKAKEKAIALGIAVGSGYLYETTFEKEVYSDLYGERGVLMGGIQGMFKAQYEVLRANGHSPSEAFNETVEEATQSLFPLIGQYGMDYMYAACSTTARRGALDWAPVFEKANRPVFEALYKSVRDGTETRKSLEFNNRKTYRQDLEKELKEIDSQEIWRAGKTVPSAAYEDNLVDMKRDTFVLPRRRFGRPLPPIDPCLGAYVDPTLSSPKHDLSEPSPLSNKLTPSDRTAPLDSILAAPPHFRRPLIRARSLQPQFLLPNTPSNQDPHVPLPYTEPTGALLTSDDEQEMTELPPDVSVEDFLQSLVIRRSRNTKRYKRIRGKKGRPVARAEDAALLMDSSDPIATDTPRNSQEELTRKKNAGRMRRVSSTKNPVHHRTSSLRKRLTRAGADSGSASDHHHHHHESGDSQALEFAPIPMGSHFRSRKLDVWRLVDPHAPFTFPTPFFSTSVPTYNRPQEPLSHWAAVVSENRTVENPVIVPETPAVPPRAHCKFTRHVAAALTPDSAALSFVPLNEHETQLKTIRGGTTKNRSA